MNKKASDDEIMAEYLLKGHKMLPNSCKVCGNPLFSVRGKTTCVTCPEQENLIQNETNEPVQNNLLKINEKSSDSKTVCELSQSLRKTLINLCKKIDESDDAERCSKLMDALKTGVDAFVKLY